MKRSLVIGCAALALAAGCGTASAQSKFDVVIGGDAFFQVGYVNQDRDTGLRSTEFQNRFRLNITPKATADNGMEYGGRIRLRTGNGSPVTGNGVTADRAFLFANTTFGTIQAGVVNGLSDEFGIIGPNVEGIAGGPDNNTVYFLNGSPTYALLPTTTNNFRAFVSGDTGTKILYLTPTIAGFQGGISYMPQTGDVNQSVNRIKDNGNFQDVVEVGGLYKNEFGDFSVEASAFYQFGKTQSLGATSFENLSSVHVGANVGYGGFKVGGSYAYSGDSGYDKSLAVKEKQDVWIAGAQYTTGPLVFAIDYQHSRSNGTSPFTGTVAPVKANLYQAGVTYTVAPGLTTGLEYSYLDLDSKLTTAANGGVNPDDRAHIIMLDTRFAF
ncbi:porin [Azospirillum rugosum]|uniref:Porin n=1 Tax=Azospirillum rugosum TaxID=416170 RepID=A0ABS4SMW4_9PROT|nr:porin [Azospirillum rugosum]MBP2293894.1 putative porin [Azospirillum rugosum]MDQ0526919.1 putative porin [Azospirillum rugosum]